MPSPPAGDRPAEAWIAARLGALRPGERVLALCRSRATATLVRRWATRRGGALGLEVALVGALAAQLPRAAPHPDAHHLPAGSALAARLGDRPGLVRVAARWVRELRLRRALGAAVSGPPWLEELAPGPFARDPDDEVLLRLVELVRARGRALTASLRWDRVVALGFDDAPDFLDPADAAVAEALAGALPAPRVPEARPWPSVVVPDVVAEARTAVALALDDPAGTLVLVGSDATARRVRDALDRNGLGGALRDPVALGTHPLASAVRRAVEWFAPGSPSILAADLFFVLGRTSLARLHPVLAARLAELLPGDDDAGGHLDERALSEVLEHSRLRDAPLDRWVRRADELVAAPPGDDDDQRARLRRAAAHLRLRLEAVDAAVHGRPLAGAGAGDDFEDAVRELLGDLPGPAVPPAGSTGALFRLLIDLRVRVHDDPVGRAILGSLRDRAERPATAALVHEALSGPGPDPQVLPDGVDVLPLDQWDGRPCRTLVVLDVHDHGLFRPTPPDPLLDEAAIAALGVPTPAHRRAHLLERLHGAATAAGRVVFVVSRTDPTGRDTVPPVDLALAPADLPPPGSYGASLPLPELRRLGRLAVAPGVRPAPAADGERTFLARAANLEWTAEGRQPHGPVADVAQPASLATVLRAVDPTLPAELRAWLGFAEGVPEAALPEDPERPHSVSRLLQPLARCAWQAFATVVLKVRERAELTDALDPRELGTVAHQALQDATAALDFRRRPDPEDAALALATATDDAFRSLLAGFGALSPARVASAHGLRDRWKRHLRSWVAARATWPPLRSWEPRNHPTVVAAEDRLRQLAPAVRDEPGWAVRSWIVAHRDHHPGGDDRELRRVDDRRDLPPSASPDLPAFLLDPVMDAVRAALREADAHRSFTQGDAGRFTFTAVAAEVPFGDPRRPPAPVHGLPGAALALPAARLRFGAADLLLRGAIDRVDFLRTERGEGFVVTDYKTGKAGLTGDEFRRQQWALEDPQLLVYAMVLARAAREGELPEGLRVGPVAIAHDRVRHTFREKDAAARVPDAPDTWTPVDGRWLRLAAQDLGHLVDGARAGRWPLRPHRHRCPKLSRSGFCPVAPACRLRGLPDGTP